MDENDNHIGRTTLFLILILLASLIARLALLQSSQALERRRYSDPVVSTSLVRGTIYDRNGYILAIQAPDYGFEINLSSSSPSYAASILEPYLAYNALEIETMINQGATFLPLQTVPTKQECSHLEKLLVNFSIDNEIKFVKKEVRKYPITGYTKKLIGEVDDNLNGISGIEKVFNSELVARPILNEPIVKGSSLVLTLDMNLQFKIQLLEEIAKDSSVAILSKEGEILAYYGDVDDSIIKSLASRSQNARDAFDPAYASYSVGSYQVLIKTEDEKLLALILDSVSSILTSGY